MTTNVQATGLDENNNPVQQTKKKKFKMPGALTIIIAVVFFVMFLSWIPHAGGGKAAEITIDGVVYKAGSLGAWQNYILWNAVGGSSIGEFTDVASWGPSVTQDIVEANGLDWDSWLDDGTDGVYGYVSSASVPWTMSAFADGSQNMAGIFDVFKALFGGYFMAWDVAFYLVGIYAIVLILMETETLQAGVSSLVKGMGGRELLLIPILFVLFSLGGTLFGMQEETLGLLPIIVPVLIIAGFDAATGMMVAVIGTTTGIAASVLDPFSVGVMAQGLGVNIGAALIERLILFVIYTAFGAAFVTWYAARVRKNPELSCESEKAEENKVWATEKIGDVEELKTMTGAQKAALSVFGLVFVWMIFTIMPWIDWFPGLETNPGWMYFSNLFMAGTLIGWWFFVELGIVFIGAAVLIGMFFKYKPSQLLVTFKNSFIDMFGVITIIAFSRAISAIMSGTGLTYGMIYGMGADGLTGDHVVMFSMVWLLIFTVMALFIPSTSGLAGVTAPIAGGVISAAEPAAKELLTVGILMVYPLAQGCVNMFSPTGTAVIQAQQSNVSYGKVLPWLLGFAGALLALGAILIAIILGAEHALGFYA